MGLFRTEKILPHPARHFANQICPPHGRPGVLNTPRSFYCGEYLRDLRPYVGKCSVSKKLERPHFQPVGILMERAILSLRFRHSWRRAVHGESKDKDFLKTRDRELRRNT